MRFAVDALQLESWHRDWDVVAWNHPHLGTEDLKLHGCLLAHFLDGAAKSLRPNGIVVLALLEGQERRWQLLKHAQAQRFDLSESSFELAAFPGYECKRNSTGKSFQSLHVQKTARAPVRSRLYHLRWGGEAGQGDAGIFDAADASLSRKPVALALECAECGKGFATAQGLKTHVRQVHELGKYADRSESLSLKCESCGRAFRDSEALTQHRLAVHSSGRTRDPKSRGRSHGFGLGFRTCEICGMSMPLGSSAAAHLEALRPLVDLPLSCACGRSFNERRALEQHQHFCGKATPAAKRIFTMTRMVSFLRKLCPCCEIQEKRSRQQRHQRLSRNLAAELKPWALRAFSRGLETLQCCTLSFVEAGRSPSRHVVCLEEYARFVCRRTVHGSVQVFELGRLCWTLPKLSARSARPAVGWTGSTGARDRVLFRVKATLPTNLGRRVKIRFATLTVVIKPCTVDQGTLTEQPWGGEIQSLENALRNMGQFCFRK